MGIKRAKTFDDKQFARLIKFIDQNSTMPVRDRLLFLLSFKAGLRVSEIAKIDLKAMLNTEGKIAKIITVFSNVAKGKNPRIREIPMHAEIAKALTDFMKQYPGAEFPAISSQPFRYAAKHGLAVPETYKRMSVNSLTVYFHWLYRRANFEGASSHSGRRTFGTKLARRANQFHNSLKDVQNLLGHARLDTTENYLEPSEDTNAMVNSL